MEIFWKTIAYYNSATWIYQLLIIVAGLLLTVIYDFSVFVDCYRILCHLL